MLRTLTDWVPHLDTHLAALAGAHGVLVYGVLFGVIFVETGVVVLPFLPGDSLLAASPSDGEQDSGLVQIRLDSSSLLREQWKRKK